MSNHRNLLGPRLYGCDDRILSYRAYEYGTELEWHTYSNRMSRCFGSRPWISLRILGSISVQIKTPPSDQGGILLKLIFSAIIGPKYSIDLDSSSFQSW